LLVAIAAHADIVHLDDGSQVEGKLTKTPEGWLVAQSNGEVITVNAEHVTSIEANRAPNPNAAGDRLASIRRTVEQLSDLHQIIDRYDKFLEQNTDSSVAEDARQDLAVWRQRLDQGLVRVGAQWVTSAQRDHLREVAQVPAIASRDLIRANKLKEAQASITAALADDPQSAFALYLQGVIYCRQEQFTLAKKAFEAANESQPNDAPTLNNLGVISWRQKSYVAALNYFDQAMLAKPLQKQILDNIVEALHAVPAESRQAPVTLRTAKDFQEQDAQLQQLAARDGQLRWGSGWVTTKQMEDLKSQEAQIKTSIDQLSHDFDLMQQKEGEIDAEIDANTREMHRVQASLTYIDPVGGGPVQLPLPKTYYDLQADNVRLAASRHPLEVQQENLRAQAKRLQSQIPAPPFTGVQQLYGVEAAKLPFEDTGDSSAPGPTTRAAAPLGVQRDLGSNSATQP
jgi:tetratricopeptide (TPR) repeat protein